MTRDAAMLLGLLVLAGPAAAYENTVADLENWGRTYGRRDPKTGCVHLVFYTFSGVYPILGSDGKPVCFGKLDWPLEAESVPEPKP